MEENKNNALEKAEKVADQITKKRHTKKKKSSGVKKSERAKPISKKQNAKQSVRRQKVEQREKAKAEKERALAEKRVEKARIKAHQKAEKEKAKATALREKNRKKAELLQKKQEIKAQKQKRKELLKRESKKDRQVRIATEKAEKRRIKEQARQDKHELKKQRLQAKRQRKQEKSKNRQRNKERTRGVGGWLAAVITLGVSTLVLASALTFVFLMPNQGDMMLEASYQKSFYDTVEQIDNIDLNLSKALATKDSGAMQLYLVDTAVNSELAENDLQQLPLQDESKFYTTKLINQIGDYSKYLNKKLVKGESLTQDDRAGLVQLYQANATLKASLQRMMSEMGANFNFSSLGNAKDGNLVLDNFNQLQNLSVEYPELIYDGPFSDGQDRAEIKGLNGNEITSAEASSIFASTFAEYNVMDVMSEGESTGAIECFNVQGMINGQTAFAQISKKGGKLVMYSFAGSCNALNYNREYVTKVADRFLLDAGLKGLEPVWYNLADNVYTINYAFVQDGIVIYPDLVKVRLCAETAMVIGLEATGYYTNHTDRVIAQPVLSQRQAAQGVSDFIDISDSRLAVVPFGKSAERLCYEFVGEYDGSTYYVYIDAINGKQVEIFKVIDSEQGTLLM